MGPFAVHSRGKSFKVGIQLGTVTWKQGEGLPHWEREQLDFA